MRSPVTLAILLGALVFAPPVQAQERESEAGGAAPARRPGRAAVGALRRSRAGIQVGHRSGPPARARSLRAGPDLHGDEAVRGSREGVRRDARRLPSRRGRSDREQRRRRSPHRRPDPQPAGSRHALESGRVSTSGVNVTNKLDADRRPDPAARGHAPPRDQSSERRRHPPTFRSRSAAPTSVPAPSPTPSANGVRPCRPTRSLARRTTTSPSS